MGSAMTINAIKKNSEDLLEKLDDLQESELAELILVHNHYYFVEHAPLISDEAFDKLVEALRFKNPQAPALFDIGAPVKTAFGEEVLHQRPMLSLDKCYDDDALAKWAEKVNGDFVAMPKIDGVASSLLFNKEGELLRAATRGDGRVGEDISQNVRMIESVVQKLDPYLLQTMMVEEYLEIRGEMFVPISRFNECYAQEFANPRNLAAGALKNKEKEKSSAYGLQFLPYDVRGTKALSEVEKFKLLEDLGFSPMPWRFIADLENAYKVVRFFYEQRSNVDYEMDGVVFRANEIRNQIRLGETAHHPRYAIAYKFQTESAQSELVEVLWSVSRTGAITPVALIKPVFLSGATITRASLHNLGIFSNLHLRTHSLVEINRRGGVIPHVERVLSSEGEPLLPPQLCPSCHSPVMVEGDFLLCSAKDTCVNAVVSSLIHFCHVLGLEGFGEKIIQKLFDQGLIRRFSDIFRLSLGDLLSLDRMGEVLAKKLLAQVEQKRTIELATFVRALGIREIGINVSEIVASNFHSLEALRALDEAALTPLHGIGERIAQALVEGLSHLSEEIDQLVSLVHIKAYEAQASRAHEGHVLFGKSVVFTGKMAHLDRKAAQDLVKKLGGFAPGSISAKTDYLVIGDEGSPLLGQGAKSTKQKDAEKLIAAGSALQIIRESEFLLLANH